MVPEFFEKNINKFNEYNLNVTFTDVSDAMIEKEKINTQEIKAKKLFEIADIDKLDKYKNQFDLVFCHNTVYHAGDQDNALKNLKRVFE